MWCHVNSKSGSVFSVPYMQKFIAKEATIPIALCSLNRPECNPVAGHTVLWVKVMTLNTYSFVLAKPLLQKLLSVTVSFPRKEFKTSLALIIILNVKYWLIIWCAYKTLHSNNYRDDHMTNHHAQIHKCLKKNKSKKSYLHNRNVVLRIQCSLS